MKGVRNWHVENARDGTYTAYEPKKQEWDEFGLEVYGPPAKFNANVSNITDLPPQIQMQLYSVSPLKCYNFVFYQAHRKQRSRRPATAVQFGAAELTEYHQINQIYGGAQANATDRFLCRLRPGKGKVGGFGGGGASTGSCLAVRLTTVAAVYRRPIRRPRYL